MRKRSSCSSLLQRIHNQRLRDTRFKSMKYIGKEWCYLFVYFLVLMIFQCPNRVYNAWRGPFPMNLDQFQNHLETNYNSFGYKSYFSFRWLFLQPEYIQIEFGKNVIDSSAKNSFQYSYQQAIYGKVTYTYSRVMEPTIAIRYRRLYLKFGSYERPKYQIHHPYQFQSFSISTLQCIIKELGFLPKEVFDWHDKSMYIKKIEDIYDLNSQAINMTIILKCGIVIGYFYKPKNEIFFPGYAHHEFNDQVRLFDASCAYTPYISYVLVGVLIYFLLKTFVRLVHLFMIHFSPLSSILDPFIMEQLKILNITSLESLDNLLLNTTYRNNHYDRLFIVRDKYLVMFMVNLDENPPQRLRQFYKTAPFMIIPIDTITDVKKDCIVLNNEYIYFPSSMNSYYSRAADWLHERLMSLNHEYRYKWEWQEFRIQEEEERQRHLRFLIVEETQYQQREYGYDIGRILQRMTSASPRFIARFRLADPQIASSDMLNEECTICLEDFQSDRQFVQWPCTARHRFHFNCMLGVLRAGNTCPLCRHPVEAATIPNIESVIPLIAQRTMATIFT